MNICLIDPYSESINFPPLGLAYLGAVAEEADANVEILPLRVLEISQQKCVEYLLAGEYNLIGLSCHSMSAFPDVKTIAKLIKQNIPNTPIILGGSYPTFIAEKVLRDFPFIDAVVRKEGEGPLKQLIENKGGFEAVKGLSFRRDSEIFHHADAPIINDLDCIPIPARHLLPLNQFLAGRGALLTSRGCRFNCPYCSPKSMFSTYRLHSLERVLAEIELLIGDYNIKRFNILDDDFTGNQQRVIELCRMIRERNLNITWVCSGRVDEVNPVLLEEMSTAGCTQIFIGIESLKDKTLKTMGRKYTLETINQAVNWIRSSGIDIKCGVIIGLPGQSQEDAREMPEMLREMDIKNVSPAFFTPLPGTRSWTAVSRYKMHFVETNEALFDLAHPVVESVDFSAEIQKSIFLELMSLNARFTALKQIE